MMNLEGRQPSNPCRRKNPLVSRMWRDRRAKVRDGVRAQMHEIYPKERAMTWEQIESSWKQLKGDVQHQTRASQLTKRNRDEERETVEQELVSYKRSLHHGTAFIRRRNPAPTSPMSSDQAGWTAAR
jgi:hypothetical protein